MEEVYILYDYNINCVTPIGFVVTKAEAEEWVGEREYRAWVNVDSLKKYEEATNE